MYLSKEFDVKIMGKLRYFFGIEVTFSKIDILISQHKCMTDLFKKTSTSACKLVATPIDPNHKLVHTKGDETVNKDTSKVSGKIIYLSHTRPNIAYVVGRA